MEQSRQVIFESGCDLCRSIAFDLVNGGVSTTQCLKHDRPRFTNLPLPLFDKPMEATILEEFITKDSGERIEFSTGMKRDVQTDKPRYDLLDKPMLKRWASLMARGAAKYGENNWKKAETQEELNRFEASLLRHVFQLLEGDRTEDHAAGAMFNIAGYEMVRSKLGK